MERLEAMRTSNPGKPIKVALRTGAIVVIAQRLGQGTWKPLYAIYGERRAALPQNFAWTHEAIGVLEAAALTTS
jgi:hypothetical protein